MSNYSFSQLMQANMSMVPGASAKVSFMTPSASNAAASQIRRTPGGATFSDRFVAPSSRSQATSFSLAPHARTKVATRQLRKENN